MLEKLKTHILWVVALLLGYSGWSRAQDPEAAGLLAETPAPLPMVAEDALSLRKAGVELKIPFDPFRIQENMDARDRANQVVDDRAPVSEAVEEASETPFLELQTVMTSDGKGIAFINGRHYLEGARIGIAEGVLVDVKRIRGPSVTVEYLGEEYVMHLYDWPRLSLLRTKAKLMPAATPQNQDVAEVPESPQQP